MRGFKHKEFAQVLRIARGSLGEVLNHLRDAHEQRLITEEELIDADVLASRALKATTGLNHPPRVHTQPEATTN
jgi:four helix bundle protein